MPGFDLPWRANQIDPVRQIFDWKNYFRKSMLRKITPRARRMGGAQRYPRRRVTVLAWPHDRLSSQLHCRGHFFFLTVKTVDQWWGFARAEPSVGSAT